MVAGEHLVQHHRAAKLVTAWINHPAGLLRGHVADRAAHRNRLAYTRTRLQRTRDSKIGNDQARIFLVNQYIFRFDITMNDRAWTRMCVVKCAGQLMKIVQRLTGGKRPVRFCQPRA